MGENLKMATFAAGCFWGVEEAFRKLKGVKNTTVGYTGGDFKNPTYKDVCSGKTGHAEAVQIEFDQNEINYQDLLNIFWEIHNPTTRNRQGSDIGSQYRSVIFYHNEKQKKLAEVSKDEAEISKKFKSEIITEITPAGKFWPAEEYHQKYLQKQGKNTC